jgi:protein-L-isoaspartate(D-aspartate) O-methyltransferase
MPLDPADVIFVNAGAARPADNWLDALKDGGRLVLPLTARYTTEQGHGMTKGAVFLIERQRRDYLAHWKSGAAIYPCVGARDDASDAALATAFEKGGWEKVTRLYRNGEVDELLAGCAAQVGP